MNKKFSTLVAVLLASGGLFYAVDATVLPAVNKVASTYVVTKAGEVTGYEISTADGFAAAWKVKVVSGKNYLVVKDATGDYYLCSDGTIALGTDGVPDGALELTVGEGGLLAGVVIADDGTISNTGSANAYLFSAAKTVVTSLSDNAEVALATASKATVPGSDQVIVGADESDAVKVGEAGQEWTVVSGSDITLKAADSKILAYGTGSFSVDASGTAITVDADGVKIGQDGYIVKNSGSQLAVVASISEETPMFLFKVVDGAYTLIEKTDDLSADDQVILAVAAEEISAVKSVTTSEVTGSEETPGASETPGSDITAGEDGTVQVEGDDVNAEKPTLKSPIYFFTGGKYLYVSSDLKVKESATAPDATTALNASWFVQNGKLVSAYAQSQGKKGLYLVNVPASKAVPGDAEASTAFVLAAQSDNTVAVTVSSNALAFGGAASSASAKVSVVLPQDNYEYVDSETEYLSGVNVVAGTLGLMDKIDGYMVVRLNDGTEEGYLTASANGASVETSAAISGLEDYKNYLWKVSAKEVNNNGTKELYYTFTSYAAFNGKACVWTVNNASDLKANAEYSEQGITLTVNGQNINGQGTAGDDTDPAVVAFYEPFTLAKTKDQLNSILEPGFDLTVKYAKDGDDAKKVFENAAAFANTMYPVANAATSIVVALWDNEDTDAKGAKQLVLEVAEISGSDVKGDFKWLTSAEITKGETAGKTYWKGFRFEYAYNGTTVVKRVAVFETTQSISPSGYISILDNNGKYYLTTSNSTTAKMPYIELGKSNLYSVKNFLGKRLNISFAGTKAELAGQENELYKLKGILAVANVEDENIGDYVSSTSVYKKAPEAEWLITDVEDAKCFTFELTNRENPDVKIEGIQLREQADGRLKVVSVKDGEEDKLAEGDIITIKVSASETKFDGFEKFTEYDLRSNNYHLGQFHGIAGNNNAYFVENHKNSHKIGAVAKADDADKWKLHFAMKQDENGKYTEVDTVYVITPFVTLNADGDGKETDNKKIKRDTLAILPYTFQKVENREFVKFDDRNNFEYYICDPENKDNSEGGYKEAQRFALKIKPNGYNFVEINENQSEAYELSENKVKLANSPEKGYLEHLATYAKDENSIMVVEGALVSEYHKVAKQGEIVKLFRSENNDQVLYEKHNPNAVVDGKVLSFLNIDNTNQFKLNPAIFVDTAYVNRVDAEGVQNAVYQYLLAVNDGLKEWAYCPYNDLHNDEAWREEHGVCADADEHKALKGRFLVNLIDTANVYGVEHIHNNPYINEAEVGGDKRAKLAFVEGIHYGDTLYLTRKGGEEVKIAMDSPEFNVAKFAFRYVDDEQKAFKIQTLYKEYLGESNNLETAEEFAAEYADDADLTSQEGYLRWINGTVVVTKGYENGDVFEIEEGYEGEATANESIDASAISVVAGNGSVTIKGAAGKNVVITNVLGQTIANTIISSDNATIAAPAGVVVVAVEGEAAVKAIVK
ncbi:DUF6383 domain-containing protein [Parabacteroides gordonii]|jgi:hypothetical protein|uniref:DUF6383 domain-containing protein n=1 Tax=Parabacteroides gordonii TaxID=574930 RepID=UPI00241FFB1D|nr:DUF6383 domain-containing protein [Parabacteroides gordonii]